MKFKRRALLVFSVLTFVVLVWQLTRPAQPEFDGKSLTHWIEKIGSSDIDEEAHAFAVIQSIGTNALPTIFQLLEKTDSAPKRWFLQFVGSIPVFQFSFKTAEEWRQAAKTALILTGEESRRMSIPVLVRLSKSSDSGVRMTAVDCLSQMMFTEPEILPVLKRAENDADVQVRTAAQNAMRRYRGVSNGVQRLIEMHSRMINNAAGTTGFRDVEYAEVNDK